MKNARPKNLNLLSIHMPLPAVVSILHRISGLILFLAIPLLLTLWQQSLATPQGFEKVLGAVSHPLCKLLMLGLLWALTHHFCAGLRHLAMDMHWGNTLPHARSSGRLVLVVSAVVTGLTAWWLW